MINLKKKKITLLTKLCIIADTLAIICFIVFYGPWSGFRNLFVNTALKTKDHEYLARVFYSDKAIEKIKSSNYFITIDDDSNTDAIVIDTREKKNDHIIEFYLRNYMLKRNEGFYQNGFDLLHQFGVFIFNLSRCCVRQQKVLL